MNETVTPTKTEALARIARLARTAERRIRLGRALEWGVTALCIALVAAIVVLALHKTAHISEIRARVILTIAAALAIVAAVVAWLRPLARGAGAVALDRHHGLHDRLSSALSFGALPEAERTPFMDAAIEDAVAVSANVEPSKAVRIPMPSAAGLCAALILVFGGVSVFEVRVHEPIVRAKQIDAVNVDPDDLDAMREFLRELEQKEQSDETKAAIAEFNQLIEDLSKGRLDREQAFHKMQELEEKLLESKEADRKALQESLERLGEEMKKSDLSRPVGDALASKDLAKAEQEMHELAKKVRDGKPDKQKLEQLREALKKAAQEHAQRMQSLQQKRDELANDILKQKQKMGDGGSDEERSLLNKKEKELERLDRDLKDQEKVGRQLDRLDRELSQAAEDLMKDLGLSAQDLDQGAEDLNRMAKQEMTQEEKEQLRQKLRDLRESLRQQGQGGKQQQARLRKFQRSARGQSGKGGQKGQQGQDQDGQDQDGQQGQNGQDGNGQDGQDGQDGQQGQGQKGQNGKNGQGNGETWVIGPNGEKIMVISKGKGQGQGQGQNGGQADQGQPGKGWGTGHDGRVQGGATNPTMGTQDTQVAGQDSGQGPTRSQVIEGAAERGFAGRGYKKVYTEYKNVAEEALNKDDIPGGYRFYVRRYFQLIRPREGADK